MITAPREAIAAVEEARASTIPGNDDLRIFAGREAMRALYMYRDDVGQFLWQPNHDCTGGYFVSVPLVRDYDLEPDQIVIIAPGVKLEHRVAVTGVQC